MTDPGRLERAAVAMLAALTIAATPTGTVAGPGEAAGRPWPAKTSAPGLEGIEYVVLIWYRRNDPIGTFQHQTYDVRKGEYTTAVDDWVRLMEEKFPAYLVRVRKVDLERERGATEQLKVGSVIQRELLVAAAESGVVLGAPLRIGPGPSAATGRASRPARPIMPGSGGSRTDLGPSPPSFPFPMPYPRPFR
jgi:hypothetical protein